MVVRTKFLPPRKAPNFFHQERCDLDSFIFAFARIHFPQCDWNYLFVKAVVCHKEEAATLTICFSLPPRPPPFPLPSPPSPPSSPPTRLPGFHLQGENFEFFVEVPASVSRWVVTDGGAHQISSTKKSTKFLPPRKVYFSSQKLSPRKVWCGQFHLHFCQDSLSPMWLMIARVLSFYTALPLPLAVWPNVSLWPSEYVHVHHGEGHNVALMNQYNLKTFRIDLVVVEIIQHTWLEVAIRQYLIFSTCNAFAAWPTCPLWATMISFQGSLPIEIVTKLW